MDNPRFTYEVEILQRIQQLNIKIIDETTDTVYATIENVKGNNSLFIGFGATQYFSFEGGWCGHSLNLTARVNSSSMTFDSIMDCEHYVWNTTSSLIFMSLLKTQTRRKSKFNFYCQILKSLILKSMFSIFNLTI